jgi:hypothetical protein
MQHLTASQDRCDHWPSKTGRRSTCNFRADNDTIMEHVPSPITSFENHTYDFVEKNMQVDAVLARGSLHTVEMGSVINVSAVYASSVFRWHNIRSTRDYRIHFVDTLYYRNCPTTQTESSGKRYGRNKLQVGIQ